MKISEIMAKSTSPTYVYHVTPTKNVKWIMQDGLVPEIGSVSSSYGETEERVYFFPSKADAEDAAMNWLGDRYEGDILSLLEVDVTGMQLKKDVDWEYYTNEVIPPDRIKVLSTDI